MRRWQLGTFEHAGLRFRVEPGRKAPGDLRLDVWTPSGWRAVPMSLGFVLADFFGENEDLLYPPPRRGHRKYVEAVAHSAKHGWEKAQALLHFEQQQRSLFEQHDGPDFDWAQRAKT